MQNNRFFSNIKESVSRFIGFILLLLIMQFVLRVFEFSLANINHHQYILSDAFIGFLFDILFVFSFSLKVFILYFLFFLLSKKLSKYYLIIVIVILAAVGYGFARYFGLMLYPVDKVLFYYSINELFLIMRTEGGMDLFSISSLVIFAAILYFSYRYFSKIKFSNVTALIIVILMITSAVINGAVIRNNQKKTSEEIYHTRVNKTCFFIQEAKLMIKQKQLQSENLNPSIAREFQSYYPDRKYVNTLYPLLHRPAKSSVLSEFIHKTDRPPNIVIIIVESLTRCYSGPNAWAGSYTPFLDSLAEVGLYWENFISTSERTIGVLPSILGSLPSANEGFSIMSGNMPNHLSLVSILKKNRYFTNFFYGGDPSFDNTNTFLSRQGIHLIQSGNYYSKEGNVYWGLNDSLVYQKSIEYRRVQSAQEPYLNVYLTLSTHGPFDIPGIKSTEQFLLNTWSKNLNITQQEYLKKHTSKLASYYYTDQQIKRLFYSLKSSGELENTIFIVTGDHGVVQVCTENPIKRYHVPLIIYSSLLKRSKSIKAINSHNNITPSLLAYLQSDYKIKIPQQAHWLGDDFDTSNQVQSKIPVPIMELNRSVNEVVYGEYFLSKGKLFYMEDGLKLKEVQQDSVFLKLDGLLKSYVSVNHYVCNHNKLILESVYNNWGNIFEFLEQKETAKISLDSTSDYVNLRSGELFSSYGNYRVLLEFDLLPNNINPSRYPYFVLDISDANGQTLSYNSLGLLSESTEFDLADTNHFSFSLETSIPNDIEHQKCQLKAYLWNNNSVELKLENVKVSLYKQK